MYKVEFSADLNIRVVRQFLHETYDARSLFAVTQIDQLVVGRRSPVISPKAAAAGNGLWPQGIKTHLFVISEEHDDIAAIHDLLNDLYAVRPAIDNVSDHKQGILR